MRYVPSDSVCYAQVKTFYCPNLGWSGSEGASFSFEYLQQTEEFWLDAGAGCVQQLRRTHDIDATLAWKTPFCVHHHATQTDLVSHDFERVALESHAVMFPVNSGRTSDGNTPFHLAVISDNLYIVKQLLVYGGYEGEESLDPRTPTPSIHEKSAQRQLSNCKLFNSEYSCVKLTPSNKRGYQPLHEAIAHGNVRIVYALGAADQEDLFNSPYTKFKVEHHELKRSLTLLELAVASKHLDLLSLLLMYYDGSETMGAALHLAGELDFTPGASLLLAKMVHDSCAKFFRELVSRDGVQAAEKEKQNAGQITWEQIGLKVLEKNNLQLASWVVSRFLRCADGFVEEINAMPNQPSQQDLDSMLNTVFKRCCNGALASFRSALIAPPSLTSNLITTLNLSGNHLEEIPLAVFQLPKLKMLILSDNQIKVLPVPEGSSIHYSEDSTDGEFYL